MSEPTVRPFQAEVSQVLHLVVNSLYSHKEVFLRELISNASDALDKRRFQALSQPALLEDAQELSITITPDVSAGTLTIADNGIGMTEQELVENLGTIARSGTREFLQKIEQARQAQVDGVQLIGQFGVGFYSAYLVADRVEVTTRAAGTDHAFRWVSDAKESFTVEPAERSSAGTTILLHIKEDQKEFLQDFRLRALVKKYSDFIGHPILLPRAQSGEDEQAGAPELERVNQGQALWTRAAKDVTEEQYDEFYKHLSHDWQPALGHRHFHVEGTQFFSGILFLPKRPPFDLYDPNADHGVRLYVKRVFIMDNCEELLPRYLRFVRGVVDSEDLPLNVSREILQDSRLIKVIRKQVINHTLSMIEELAEQKPDEYRQFWAEFGAALKEGLHFEAGDRERLAKLLRYESSTQGGLTGLAGYVERMKEGQKDIYYASGTTRELLHSSPHTEQLRQRGIEVLYMTDPIDPFAVEGLGEFDGKKLVSVMDESLDLGDSADAKEEQPPAPEKLLQRFQDVLGEHVSEVRVSKRLAQSPVCLVTPEGGLAPHIERMMRARKMNLPPMKRIMEVNPTHPVITKLQQLQEKEGSSSRVEEWVQVLYDQALIAEGSPVENPARFAQRLTALVGEAASAALQ